MNSRNQFGFKKLIVPGIVMLAFWILAIVGWQSSGYIQPLILFGYIGTSLGVGLGLYATLPNSLACPSGRLANSSRLMPKFGGWALFKWQRSRDF